MIHPKQTATSRLFVAFITLLLTFTSAAFAQIAFVDATEACGLPLMNAARLSFVDLNNDGRADIVARVADRYRVFINHPDANAKFGFRFAEVEAPALPGPIGGDVITFADLDNDGLPDAIFTRYLDTKNPKFSAPTTQPTASCWIHGNGDGTFASPQLLTAATRGTTACIAVGDADCDGLPDIVLGNWYDNYGESNTAYPSDLLLQRRDADGRISFERVALPDNDVAFDEDRDAGPRPTYGVMLVRLLDDPAKKDHLASASSILELSYGRRANRLYVPTTQPLHYEDCAIAMHLDGDAIRHGKYPDWLKEIAKTDKRFDREDEKPFRSHGNNFDAAVGDVDGDGKFDLFLTEITHAWAGESADRSRFLIRRQTANGQPDFVIDPKLNVDRPGTHDASTQPATSPSGSTTRPSVRGRFPNWNQGDLFAALADLDHDGRLDLILCSSDYPDPPPHQNRLRFYHQEADGSLRDVTDASGGDRGIDHLGAQQPSLADLDGDGDLDLLVGQSFNRFTKEMIDQRTPPGPVARIYLNQVSDARRARGLAPNSIELRLIGDPKRHVTLAAYNAVVRMTTTVNGQRFTQCRQLIGPGGHNGKGADQLIHFGLGDATEADELAIDWPADIAPTVLRHVRPGMHTVRCTPP